MVICYAGRSRPSAEAIAAENSDIQLIRSSRQQSDINWGRRTANARLNPDINNSVNKRRMREIFREHGVPMPELLTDGRSVLDLRPWGVDEWSYPIVGRPDTHSKGRGFWKCNNFQDVQRAIRGTRRKRAATHFMEFIDAPREYRVHVFKGMSIRISEKDFSDPRDKRSYSTTRPQHRIAHVRRAAKQAVEALGLDFGAVDILADDENCWVLEVNAAPGTGGSVPRLYAEMFRRWYDGEWE